MRLDVTEPLDIDDARIAAKAMATQRRAAEALLEQSTIDAAENERTYRKTLAQQYANLAGRDVTAAQREALARSEAADAGYDRDLAEGMVKVHQQRLRGLEGERAMLNALTQWSMRMYEREVPPATHTYGGQRAA